MISGARRRRCRIGQPVSISVDGLAESEQEEQLQRFAEDVLPVLKREIPSEIWERGPVLAEEGKAVVS